MIVCTPMFLDNAGMMMLQRALVSFGQGMAAQEGDEVLVTFIGTTKDTDGWPMKKWKLTLRRKDAP